MVDNTDVADLQNSFHKFSLSTRTKVKTDICDNLLKVGIRYHETETIDVR